MRKSELEPRPGNIPTELFDRAGRLKPLESLPAHVAAQIASFDIIKTTVRREGETITTEELIRVKTRDRKTATVARRGGTTVTEKHIKSQPIARRLVTTQEKAIGRGRTAAAGAVTGQTRHQGRLLRTFPRTHQR
jgi:hypothetical protein